MPDRMPEDMPDKMTEGMSDRMPEDLPGTKRINVMVGITRSKVIIICTMFFLECGDLTCQPHHQMKLVGHQWLSLFAQIVEPASGWL
jgi:hypothetical protein